MEIICVNRMIEVSKTYEINFYTKEASGSFFAL
jgi:hypothetical protein